VTFNPREFSRGDFLEVAQVSFRATADQAAAIWCACLDYHVVQEWPPQYVGGRQVYRLGGCWPEVLEKLRRRVGGK
jgi:hypothetical protein